MTASTRGRRNRQRGQEGEREAVAFLREHGVGCEDRLLGQERDGGYDLDTEAGPCEVKRRKKLPAYMIPREGVAFVMARQDYKRWYVVLDAEAWCRLWLRDRERTAVHESLCSACHGTRRVPRPAYDSADCYTGVEMIPCEVCK